MSHEENNLTPGEQELEGALSRLTPVPPPFGVEQITALATGARRASAAIAAAKRRMRVWQAIAAVLAVATGAAICSRPGVRTVEVPKVIYVESTSPGHGEGTARQELVGIDGTGASLTLSNGEFAYLRLRDKVLSRGVDALHTSPELPETGHAPSLLDRRQAVAPEAQTPWYVSYIASGGKS